jgi:lipopolysaccharide heptosyltransferase II
VVEKRQQFAVANLGRVSDVLLSTPLLESLRLAHPTSRITYIVSRGSAEVLDYSPFVNELIIWPDDRSAWGNGFKMLRRVVRKRFDGAFPLVSNVYLNTAFRLSRTPVHIPEASSETHRSRYFLSAALKNGFPSPEPVRLHYTVTPTEQREGLMMLSRWNVDPGHHTVIAVHPGTGPALSDKRRWSCHQFREVIHQISVKPGHKVVILGGTEERKADRDLVEGSNRNVVDLTSCLSFREFVAVLAQCHLLVHNASAPLYLANAVGVPVLSVFGHQNPAVWGPLSPRDRIVRHELPCSPCAPEFVCERSFECLRALTSREVIAELDRMLSANHLRVRSYKA